MQKYFLAIMLSKNAQIIGQATEVAYDSESILSTLVASGEKPALQVDCSLYWQQKS